MKAAPSPASSSPRTLIRGRRNSPDTPACGDYEIIRALKEGRGRAGRHRPRFGADRRWTRRRGAGASSATRDFDMAETSASSYVVAKDQRTRRSRRCRCSCIGASATASCSSSRAKGIKSPKRPDRAPSRHQVLPGDRHTLDARHPRTRVRGAAQVSCRYFAELDEDIEFATPPDGPEDHAAAACAGSRSRRCWPKAKSTR